jgi:hypothetical protein
MQQAPNPYAPPAYDEQSPTQGPSQLPETSVWLMMLLSLVTLGLYIPHWLYTRGRIVNRLADFPLVSINWVRALYVLYGVSVLVAVPGIYASIYGGELNGALQLANVLDKVANLATLFMVFHLRTALHALRRSEKGGAGWLSGVGTFFFSIFYLQYKLNRGLLMAMPEPGQLRT